MMSAVLNILSIIFATAGIAFMLISLFGLVVYPDFFCRLHVQGVGDTIGAFLIILAMILKTGFTLLSAKMFLVFIFIMLTNPLGTNMMMIAAFNRRRYQDYASKRDLLMSQLSREEHRK